MMKKHRIYITKQLRELILDRYPNATRKESYMKFLCYLFFAYKNYRNDNGFVIAARETLAEIEEKKCNNNYKSWVFLQEIKDQVLPEMEFTGWSKQLGLARVIVFDEPTEIQEAKLTLPRNANGLVNFFTGKAISKRKLTTIDRELVDEANGFLSFENYNYRLIKYLNDLPINIFSKTQKMNWDTVCDFFEEMKKSGKYSRKTLARQADILLNIQLFAKPIYRNSNNIDKNGITTDRIFPLNDSIPWLQKDLRNTLCQGCFDFDIRSAHLAIISKTWNIPDLYDFLKSGNNVWEYLSKYFNNKSDSKEFIYSLVYGKGVKNLYKMNSRALQDVLIQSIIAAREIEKKRIIKDCKISASDFKTVRRKLACDSQRMELEILYPLIDILKKNNRIRMVAWMHDGMILKITDSRNEKILIKRVCKTINNNCQSLDIPTFLEYQRL